MKRYLIEEYGERLETGETNLIKSTIVYEDELFEILQEGRNRKIAVTRLEDFCIIDWS